MRHRSCFLRKQTRFSTYLFSRLFLRGWNCFSSWLFIARGTTNGCDIKEDGEELHSYDRGPSPDEPAPAQIGHAECPRKFREHYEIKWLDSFVCVANMFHGFCAPWLWCVLLARLSVSVSVQVGVFMTQWWSHQWKGHLREALRRQLTHFLSLHYSVWGVIIPLLILVHRRQSTRRFCKSFCTWRPFAGLNLLNIFHTTIADCTFKS